MHVVQRVVHAFRGQPTTGRTRGKMALQPPKMDLLPFVDAVKNGCKIDKMDAGKIGTGRERVL